MGEDEVGEGDLSLETVTHTQTHKNFSHGLNPKGKS